MASFDGRRDLARCTPGRCDVASLSRAIVPAVNCMRPDAAESRSACRAVLGSTIPDIEAGRIELNLHDRTEPRHAIECVAV